MYCNPRFHSMNLFDGFAMNTFANTICQTSVLHGYEMEWFEYM